MTQLIKYKGQEFSPETFQKMLDAGLISNEKATGQKNDLLQSAYGQAPHGWQQSAPASGGLFSRPTVDPQIYSTVVGLVGLTDELFSGVNDLENPEYELLTGVAAATGTNPTDFTGTPPVPGDVKVATHRTEFGKFYMGTEKLQIPMMGGRTNRGDYDRVLMNNIYLMSRLLPNIPSNINTEAGLQMLSFAVHFIRTVERVVFNGNANTANTDTATGFIKEFDGFDRLIKTGYTDLATGNAVVALDSQVIDFGSTDVTTSAGGDKVVQILAELWNFFENLCDDSGMLMPDYRLVMRRDLFYAITENYPRSYLTIANNVTTDSNGERVTVDSERMTMFRDEMRNGKYLWIMGNRVPVRVTNAIPKVSTSFGFKAPIYIFPLSAGGRRTTYMEAFNINNDSVREWMGLSNSTITVTQDGLWALGAGQKGLGSEKYFGMRPRLVVRTPHLCGLINNVGYKFAQQLYPRDAYPAEAYYKDGGRTVSTAYYTS